MLYTWDVLHAFAPAHESSLCSAPWHFCTTTWQMCILCCVQSLCHPSSASTCVVCIRCPLGSATYLVTFIDWYCNTVFRHNMYIHMYVWCSVLGSPAVPFWSISTVAQWTAHSTRQCYFNECVLLTRDCLPASCHACTRAHLLTIGLMTTYWHWLLLCTLFH